MDFFTGTGSILSLAGPGAVLITYAFLGLLALGIMVNLSTLVRIWPIPGGMFLYIREFVDEEIGHTVGILYW